MVIHLSACARRESSNIAVLRYSGMLMDRITPAAAAVAGLRRGAVAFLFWNRLSVCDARLNISFSLVSCRHELTCARLQYLAGLAEPYEAMIAAA